MLLIDTAIRQSKPQAKAIKLFDGRGLFLLLAPSGSRCWRFKYRIEGREKLLALGVYPEVPLKLARERREEARQLLAYGIDPSAKRQAEKRSRADTFEAIAREWLAKQQHRLASSTFHKATWTFESHVFGAMGVALFVRNKGRVQRLLRRDALSRANGVVCGRCVNPLQRPQACTGVLGPFLATYWFVS